MDKNELWLSLWTAEVSAGVKRHISINRVRFGRTVQDGEDAYAQAMFKSWQNIEKYNPQRALFKTWACGIANMYMLHGTAREETIEPYKASQLRAVVMARHSHKSRGVRLARDAQPPKRSKRQLAIYNWLQSNSGHVELSEFYDQMRAIGLMSRGYANNQKLSRLRFLEVV